LQSVVQLREALKVRGLKRSGNRAELEARLESGVTKTKKSRETSYMSDAEGDWSEEGNAGDPKQSDSPVTKKRTEKKPKKEIKSFSMAEPNPQITTAKSVACLPMRTVTPCRRPAPSLPTGRAGQIDILRVGEVVGGKEFDSALVQLLGEEGAAGLESLLSGRGPGQAAPVLLQLLRWEGRPAGERMERLLADLGELLTVEDCGEIEEVLASHGGAGPVLLSASPAVLECWGSLVARVMTEGEGEEVWRLRASLVNRVPGLAPALASTPPEGVGWVAAGLVRRGDWSAAPWLTALVEQVGEGEDNAVAAVGRLLGPCWWRHASTGNLFKERALSLLHPALTAPWTGPRHLSALLLLQSTLSRPLMAPHLPALQEVDLQEVELADSSLGSHQQAVAEHCRTPSQEMSSSLAQADCSLGRGTPASSQSPEPTLELSQEAVSVGQQLSRARVEIGHLQRARSI
jgi:hypothetical protein